MADVAQMPVEVENNTEEVPKKKRQSKLPRPGSKTLAPEAFYAYTKALTGEDWPHVLIYVLRLWPRIIREPKYIDKLSQPVTEEYLVAHHGSGKYWLMLNDTDTDQTICQTYPEIDNPNAPPLIDLRELDIAHDKNRTFVDHLKRTGKLTMDGEVVQPGRDSANLESSGITAIALEAMRMNRDAKPGIENQAFSKMMEMMSTASSKSIEIALSHAKKEDPSGFMGLMVQMMNSQATMMTTLLTKLFDGGAGKAPDPVMMKMLDAAEARAKQATEDAKAERERAEKDRQRAHELDLAERKHAHELDLERLKQKAESASPTAMVKEVLELQKEIAQLGSDEPKNWKEKLVDQGFEALPEILNLAKGYVQARNQPPRQPQQQQQPQQAQQQQTAQPAAGVQQPVANQTPLDPDVGWLAQMFESRGPDFVLAFRTDPLAGAEAAAPLISFMPAIHQRLVLMGRAKILEAIECLPQMKVDLFSGGANPEMLNQFIDDFLAGPEDDEDDGPVIPEGRKRQEVK